MGVVGKIERVGGGVSALRLLRPVLAWIVLVLAAAGPLAVHAQSQPVRRIALVMGNATYTAGGQALDNPTNDAALVAAKLSSLGFQVTYRDMPDNGPNTVNLGQLNMRNLIGNFMSSIRDGDLVVIYYSGHGVELDGQDYMLPVDVSPGTPLELKIQGISLEALQSDKATFGVIIVFDACRDNPFIRRVKGSVAGAHALSPRPGDLVIFAASSGGVAIETGPNKAGVFATAFTNALSLPDASISKIYQSTLREVRKETSDGQAPQRFGDLADEFIFNPSGGATHYAAVVPPARQPASEGGPAQAPAPAAPTQLTGNDAVPASGLSRSSPSLIPSASDAPPRPIVVSNKPVPDNAAPEPVPAAPAPAPVAANLAPTSPASPAATAATAAFKPPVVTSNAPIPDQGAAASLPASPGLSPAPSPSVPAPAATLPAGKPAQLALNTTSTLAPNQASAAATPAPVNTMGPATIPMAPVRGGQYTIASLGQDIAPEPPQMEPVPELTLPTSFCSVEARNSYITEVHQPAYLTALRNVDAANAYLAGVHKLTDEYTARGGGFAIRLLDLFKRFQVVSNTQQSLARTILALDPKIREIPVAPCK